jgi:hypothetical protein
LQVGSSDTSLLSFMVDDSAGVASSAVVASTSGGAVATLLASVGVVVLSSADVERIPGG